jgi:alpha-tubulin suppressor-like RCC1 family protein
VAVLADHSLIGWGECKFHQLSSAALTRATTPTPSSTSTIRTAARKVASYSLPIAIPLPASLKIHQVACGNRHTLCLTHDGRVFAFGCNKFGQLGCGDAIQSSADAIEAQTAQACRVGEKLISIHAGWSHAIAIGDQGSVIGFGRNTYGQLGYDMHV